MSDRLHRIVDGVEVEMTQEEIDEFLADQDAIAQVEAAVATAKAAKAALSPLGPPLGQP